MLVAYPPILGKAKVIASTLAYYGKNLIMALERFRVLTLDLDSHNRNGNEPAWTGNDRN